ncbi:MAG: HigA family addiction module antitoxin [Chitinophagaceae bacterium]
MKVNKTFGVNGKEVFSDALLHPGELLGEELEARDISQKEFAEAIGLRPSHLNELIKGKRNVSALLALRIEKELKIEADIWMRLQIQYDLEIARKQLKVA